MKLLALMQKEFLRFFRDPRLILTMLLPGVLIYALYSILGVAVNDTEAEPYDFKVYYTGGSAYTAVLEAAAEAAGNTLEWVPATDGAAAREAVGRGEAAALVVFSEAFDTTHGVVTVVYDPLNETSSAFYAFSTAVLREAAMPFTIAAESLASDDVIGREVMRNMMPLLIVCFVFTACMSVTLESVAGEKERGTLATVLVTSVRRSDIALGKILPLSCISMLGALSSFLGVALSMPKLMGIGQGVLGGYGFGSYALVLLLVLSVVPLVVSLISALSTLSRSVKEASAYTSVVMILAMVVSVVTSFLPAFGDWAVAVPVLNAVVSMQGVLAGGMPVWQSFVSAGVNLAYTALLVFAMARMFSSERIMFGK